MKPRPVFLVVALPAEAKPLATHFALRRVQPDQGFPLYRRDQLSLAVCGPGKLAAAAAVGRLGARQDRGIEAVWINLGIAGHRRRPLGQGLLARRVIDAACGHSWEPQILFEPPLETETLVTLDRPLADYDPRGAVDMEAAGFLTAALRFAPPPLVHCIKVVSDNELSPARGVSAPRVRQWISAQLPALELVIDRLRTLGPPSRPLPSR